MKVALLVVLLAVGMVVACGGCVSVEDQREIDTLMRDEKALWSERVKAVDALLVEKKELRDLLTAKIREIRGEVDAGTLTYDKSKEFIASIRADIEDTVSDIDNEVSAVKERFTESQERIRSQVKELEAKGYGKLDMIGAVIMNLLTGGGVFAATNYYRSRKHPLTKEIT